MLRVLVQSQITVGVFSSLLLARLSNIDNTRTAAQVYRSENKVRNVLMLLGIPILYSSIVYLLATSTLTWSPLILFIDSVESPGTQIGTFVALGAGLAAISLGQLSRTVLDFLDPYANPSSVVNRLADGIDPELISSEVVL